MGDHLIRGDLRRMAHPHPAQGQVDPRVGDAGQGRQPRLNRLDAGRAMGAGQGEQGFFAAMAGLARPSGDALRHHASCATHTAGSFRKSHDQYTRTIRRC